MRPVPLLSPPASYEPQMQGTENHGRRTPKCKVSWAGGRLSPGMYSRDWCHFGAVPVCGSLCEVRSGDARWVLRGPAGQWRLHFEARVRCINGTLRHAFLLIKVAHGYYAFSQIKSDKFKCHWRSVSTMARGVPDRGLRRGATRARWRRLGGWEAVRGLQHRSPARF